MSYTKKDFASSNEVKWCPGCGDYAILSAVQMSMAKMGLKPHEVCIVSGIGCSSRFPYYMNTYGIHSIHGRAPAVATGVKLQNPDLSVWIITGDGDGLSIGGNHLAHIIRRNLNVNILLFNNEIYGLTKGQYSPLSKQGLKTKSTPFGSLDRPFNFAKFATGAGAGFFARTIDTDPKHMMDIFQKAEAHNGCSVIEIFQNCIIFNDKVHDEYTNRATRGDHSIRLEHGQKMLFGQDKGLKISNGKLEVCSTDEAEVFDQENDYHTYLMMNIDGPMPIGVLKQVGGLPIYNEDFQAQLESVQKSSSSSSVKDLLFSGKTWEVN